MGNGPDSEVRKTLRALLRARADAFVQTAGLPPMHARQITRAKQSTILPTMSLTYQPFATAPEIEHLTTDLQMNMAGPERLASAVVGAGLLAVAINGGNLGRCLLCGAAVFLLGRGLMGRCAIYETLNVDRRHEYLAVNKQSIVSPSV
jgi:hypothetical protein